MSNHQQTTVSTIDMRAPIRESETAHAISVHTISEHSRQDTDESNSAAAGQSENYDQTEHHAQSENYALTENYAQTDEQQHQLDVAQIFSGLELCVMMLSKSTRALPESSGHSSGGRSAIIGSSSSCSSGNTVGSSYSGSTVASSSHTAKLGSNDNKHEDTPKSSTITALIHRHGGSTVAHPIIGTTHAIITNRPESARVMPYRGKVDVLCWKWLEACVRKRRLLCLEKRYVYYATPTTALVLSDATDDHGDRFRRPLCVRQMRRLLDGIAIPQAGDHNHAQMSARQRQRLLDRLERG